MSDYHPRARESRNELAREAASQFDAVLVRSLVGEHVGDQSDAGEDLIRVLNLSERAYDLSERREDRAGAAGDTSRAAFDAAEELSECVDSLVDEAVAEACATVTDDAPDWDDVWDQTGIEAAVAEARQWLQDHPDAAERAGIDSEVWEGG